MEAERDMHSRRYYDGCQSKWPLRAASTFVVALTAIGAMRD
jgi:hypothetical protein